MVDQPLPVTETVYAGRASGAHPSVTTLKRISDHLLASLGQTVDWYYAQMPSYYLRVTDTDEQMRHIELLHAQRRGGEGRLAMLDDALGGKLLCVGNPGSQSLLDVVAMLRDRPFHRVELHTAKDRSLFLHAFVYAAGRPPADFDMHAHRQAVIATCCDGRGALPRAQVELYLDVVDQDYLARSTIDRIERHIRAWARLADEDLVVYPESSGEHPETRILIATRGIAPTAILRHLAQVLMRHRLLLARGYLDLLPDVAEQSRQVQMTSVYLADSEGRPLGPDQQATVVADLAALRRLYVDDFNDFYAEGIFDLDQIEILRAALGFAGQLLAVEHPFLDVFETGLDLLRAEPALCRELCDLFAERFRPGSVLAEAAWKTHADNLLDRLRKVEPLAHAVLIEAMHSFLTHVVLTNAWRSDRISLACFVDPAVLPEAHFPQRPHGITFVRGPAGRGFHVRFRPSARGGLRLLLPRTMGQYLRYRDGLLKEVYDLAWAQQLKNKDIPEGGSKCIALIDRGMDVDDLVHQVADGLIDLILPSGTIPEIIGPHGAPRREDLVFLGPDENMTPARITWVAERARARGLPNHLTLMSSKPGSGINHKDYGVTSEGIYRWIAQVLPMVGIDPNRSWTLKITGGPDGDLGGNLIKILHREQGNRCRIVAIADGTGCAADPEGLDWNELLRLVQISSGIAAYRKEALRSPHGRVIPATDKVSEQTRNDLHNEVEADLFVPCGGRPYTINDGNWQRFLKADGTPSAKAMVEGANIFITPKARTSLEDAGLVVIKDSSANKGGVICSSYEILAGLVIDEAEFLACKERYVTETIRLLQDKADIEARALFSAWTRRQRRARLSDLSMQLSEEINRVSGLFEPVIAAHLDDATHAQGWKHHLEAHAPAVLVEGYADRFATRIPRAHRVAILAKRLASHLVYREGLTWCRTYLMEDRIWTVLSTYLEAEARVGKVVDLVLNLDVPGRDEIARIIAAGSQRELVRERLGQEF